MNTIQRMVRSLNFYFNPDDLETLKSNEQKAAEYMEVQRSRNALPRSPLRTRVADDLEDFTIEDGWIRVGTDSTDAIAKLDHDHRTYFMRDLRSIIERHCNIKDKTPWWLREPTVFPPKATGP